MVQYVDTAKENRAVFLSNLIDDDREIVEQILDKINVVQLAYALDEAFDKGGNIKKRGERPR